MTERHPTLTPDAEPLHLEGLHNTPEVVDPGQLIVEAGRQTAGTLSQTEQTHTPWSRDPSFQDESWAFDGDEHSDKKPTENHVANLLAAHGWTEHPSIKEQTPQIASAPEVPKTAVAPQPERRGRLFRRRQSASVPGDEHNDFWAPIK